MNEEEENIIYKAYKKTKLLNKILVGVLLLVSVVATDRCVQLYGLQHAAPVANIQNNPDVLIAKGTYALLISADENFSSMLAEEYKEKFKSYPKDVQEAAYKEYLKDKAEASATASTGIVVFPAATEVKGE